MNIPTQYGGYAASIITDPKDFDSLEVQGVRDIYDEQNEDEKDKLTRCEVDNENPQFFSVYAHLCEGGVECIGDFETREDALKFATLKGDQYGWHVHDYTREVK